MLIYNVTVKPDASIADAWLHWMQEDHMPALMATGCFTGHRLCRLLDIDESDGPTYAAQYFCASRAAYDRYLTHHAPAMRAAGIRQFGERFSAFRTLMEVVEERAAT